MIYVLKVSFRPEMEKRVKAFFVIFCTACLVLCSCVWNYSIISRFCKSRFSFWSPPIRQKTSYCFASKSHEKTGLFGTKLLIGFCLTLDWCWISLQNAVKNCTSAFYGFESAHCRSSYSLWIIASEFVLYGLVVGSLRPPSMQEKCVMQTRSDTRHH